MMFGSGSSFTLPDLGLVLATHCLCQLDAMGKRLKVHNTHYIEAGLRVPLSGPLSRSNLYSDLQKSQGESKVWPHRRPYWKSPLCMSAYV